MSQNANQNYRDLRAKLIAKGYTFRSWAKKRGHAVGSVYNAVRGTRCGIKATKIRRELEAFCAK